MSSIHIIISALFTSLLFSCDSGEDRGNGGAENLSSDTVQQDSPPSLAGTSPVLEDGDIIFQTSGSGQSAAIQLATRSKYSHVGIIFELEGRYYVYEAVQPVSVTPLESFIARGDDGRYVVKRLKSKGLSKDIAAKMKTEGLKHKGKDYDLYFGWADDKLYCSELVYKLYDEYAGVKVGRLQKLSEFDLSSPIVKTKLKERYGSSIPMNENVISPASIFDDPALMTVAER
jgi:hypothetical protein